MDYPFMKHLGEQTSSKHEKSGSSSKLKRSSSLLEVSKILHSKGMKKSLISNSTKNLAAVQESNGSSSKQRSGSKETSTLLRKGNSENSKSLLQVIDEDVFGHDSTFQSPFGIRRCKFLGMHVLNLNLNLNLLIHEILSRGHYIANITTIQRSKLMYTKIIVTKVSKLRLL